MSLRVVRETARLIRFVSVMTSFIGRLALRVTATMFNIMTKIPHSPPSRAARAWPVCILLL